MLSWMPQIEKGSGPKYLAIAEALLADVQSGRLKPGYRLPPQRQLAKELGVDLTTVTRAFNEARRMGLIEANTGRGSYVRGKGPERETTSHLPELPIIDLSMNMPPAAAGGETARAHSGGDRGRAVVAARPDAPALPGERGSRAGPRRRRPLARSRAWGRFRSTGSW